MAWHVSKPFQKAAIDSDKLSISDFMNKIKFHTTEVNMESPIAVAPDPIVHVLER